MRLLGFCLAITAMGSMAPMRAQAYILTSRHTEPTTWKDWRVTLQRQGRAAWVVVEDPTRPLVPGLTSLLAQEPLLEWTLQTIRAGQESPLGRELRAAFGWDGPHWGLVDARGNLLLSGSHLPTPADLADQLRSAGVITRVEQLVAFLAQHPDHLEGRVALLGARAEVAQRRMLPFVKAPEKRTDDEPPQRPVLRAPLSGEEDARIWGPLAAELERHVLSGAFVRMPWWGVSGLEVGSARLSPTMQAMAQKCLPAVEDALREAPGRSETWAWWLGLSSLAGGRPLRPLLDSLVPVPGESSENVPPRHVLARYVQGAQEEGRWALVKELLLPRWEQERQWTNQVVGIEANGKPMEDGLGLSWETLLKPLLQAHLRLGETLAADQLVNDINAWQPGSVSLPRRAAAVATACGFPDLAARWGALKVIPKS